MVKSVWYINQSQINHKTKHNTHKVNEKCSKWACSLHLFLAFNYSFCVVYISCIPKQREREWGRGLVNTVLYWHFREKWLCLRLYLGAIPTFSTTSMFFCSNFLFYKICINVCYTQTMNKTQFLREQYAKTGIRYSQCRQIKLTLFCWIDLKI